MVHGHHSHTVIMKQRVTKIQNMPRVAWSSFLSHDYTNSSLVDVSDVSDVNDVSGRENL